MFRKKIYKYLSVAVTAATVLTTVFPAGVYAAQDDLLIAEEETVGLLTEDTEVPLTAAGDELTEEVAETAADTAVEADADPGDYTANGDYEFTFDKLVLAPESAEVNGGTDVTVKEDGSAEINFKGQYAQAFYSLPEGINSRRVSRIEFVGADPANFSVKVLPAPGDDSLASAGGVTYGNNALNISGLEFAYFAAMTTADGGGKYTASKVVITLVDEPEREDVQTVTAKLADMTIADDSGASVSGNTVTFNAQYQSVFFVIPDTVDATMLSKITVKGDAANGYNYKLMSEDQYSGDGKYGDGLVVSYGNPEFAVGNPNGKYLIIMSGGSEPYGSFSLDSEVDFSLETPMEVQTDIPNLWETVASADKGLGKDAFMGTCIGGGSLNDEKLITLVKKHFNAVTLENELKPDSVLNGTNGELVDDPEFGQVPKALNFANPDRILDEVLKWNEEDGVNIKVRGHVLTWHEQTPTWFFREGYKSDGEYVTPEVMTKRHEWYIKNVLNHYFSKDSKYRDLFYGFDVVNEACSDSLGTYRAAAGEGKNSEWARIYGTGSEEDAPDYILNAFRFANKYAPKSLELYYNDYNDCQPSKVPVIERLLKSVKKHEKDKVNPTRITGFGMQGHHGIDSPTKDQIIECATRYGRIVGKVQVTELDVKTSPGYDGSKAARPAEYTRMGYRYKDIYDAYREVDQLKGIDVNSFTVWGAIDSVSWLNDANNAGGGADGTQKQCPLLFDGRYQAKPAYWAIVNAEKLDPVSKSVDILPKKGELSGEWYAFDDIDACFTPGWDKDGVTFDVKVGDSVSVKNVALYANWDLDASKSVEPVAVSANETGNYSLAAPKKDVAGKKLMFDIVITLDDMAGTRIAFNNTKLTHDSDSNFFAIATIKPYLDIKKGTVSINGIADGDEWANAEEFDLTVKGGEPEASAKARVLWDDENLYVFMDVTDASLDATSTAAHEQDSIEVFIDEDNAKAGSYQEDDKQYRMNYKGEASFNGSKCKASNVDYAVKLTDKGYSVEAAFAFTDVVPNAGDKIGIDLQINDAKDGARIGTVNWYDGSGNGWQAPNVFGEALLLENDKIEIVPDRIYTGKEITPDVEIIEDGRRLVKDEDYTLKYANNVNVNPEKKTGDGMGSNFNDKLPTVEVTRTDGKAVCKINFNILPLDITTNDNVVVYSKDEYLTPVNKESKPELIVKMDGKELAKDAYTVKYRLGKDGKLMDALPAGASNADGVYYGVVTGENNYSGTLSVTLNILTKDQVKASDLKITLPAAKAYTGSAIEFTEDELKVSYKGSDLKKVSDPGVDGYMVSYLNNIDAGEAIVIIEGAGKFTGHVARTFKITGIDFKKVNVKKLASVPYTGKAQTIKPEVSYKIKNDAEAALLGGKKGDTVKVDPAYFTVKCVSGGTESGSAKYEIVGKGPFSGVKKVTLKIDKVSADSLTVSQVADQVYVKGGCKPVVTVTFGATKLVEGRDYKVSYSGNNAVSGKKKASVNISFKGNFAGKLSKSFTIKPRNLSGFIKVSAPDVKEKKGAYTTKVVLTDIYSDIKLSGSDYSIEYFYLDGENWVAVDKKTPKDTFKAGRKMRVKMTAKGKNFKGTTEAAYSIVK